MRGRKRAARQNAQRPRLETEQFPLRTEETVDVVSDGPISGTADSMAGMHRLWAMGT